MVSGIRTAEDASEKHDENALADIFGTMSQIPDVNRELAEVRVVQTLLDRVRSEVHALQSTDCSDLGCGSTIGPITAAELGIRTVDAGNPMLSMHSCREVAAAADVPKLIDVLKRVFSG